MFTSQWLLIITCHGIPHWAGGLSSMTDNLYLLLLWCRILLSCVNSEAKPLDANKCLHVDTVRSSSVFPLLWSPWNYPLKTPASTSRCYYQYRNINIVKKKSADLATGINTSWILSLRHWTQILNTSKISKRRIWMIWNRRAVNALMV